MREFLIRIMLLNYSNHPSSMWSEAQLRLAGEMFGVIVDEKFPSINPLWDETEIIRLAENEVRRIKQKYGDNLTVHIMGESNFCFTMVSLLLRQGIPCVASTTERIARTDENGVKKSIFRFKKFRFYRLP